MKFILIIAAIFFGLWLLVFLVAGLAYLKARFTNPPKNKEQNQIKEIAEVIIGKDAKETVDADIKLETEESKLNEGLDRIAAQIIEFKNNSNTMPLMVIGSLIGYDVHEIIGPDAKFEETFVNASRKLLDFQQFKVITNGRITLEEYQFSISEAIPTYHQLLADEYVDRFEHFLFNFKGYFDLIEQNHQLLTSKKRTLLIEDEFGDIDAQEWIDYLQRFAERRNLTNPHLIISNEFEAVSNYLGLIKLNNFQGKAISFLLALYDHFNQKDDKFSSVYTGVDFEMYLKESIEKILPDAYVETTPASGDHGADLIVRYKGTSIAIQAKYYTGSVGNAAVQEIHSGMGFYDADFGMVVTQSKYTEHARSLANKLGIHLESTDTYIRKIESLANG